MKKKTLLLGLVALFLIIGFGSYLVLRSRSVSKLINDSTLTYIAKCTYTESDSECYSAEFTTKEDIENLALAFTNENVYPSFYTKRSFDYPLITYHLVFNYSDDSSIWLEVYSQNYIQVDGSSFFSFNYQQLYDKLEEYFNQLDTIRV